MRWHEITEACATDAARRRSERQTKAREKFADAQAKKADAARRYQKQLRKAGDSPRQRSEAGQRYQDNLRAANAAQQAAQDVLSSDAP